MKKSKLRHIIRESIKEEIQKIQEQPSSTAAPSVNDLMNGFGSYLNSIGVDFKQVLSCGNPINTPQASTSQTQMASWLQGIFALQGANQAIFNYIPPTPSTSNQPCQFINNRINQLTNWISSFSGNPNSAQLNLKTCKLKIFLHLASWYNC